MKEKDFIDLFSSIGIDHQETVKGDLFASWKKKRRLIRQLFDCQLRGFAYFNGPAIRKHLNEGSSLKLHLEDTGAEEGLAVAVYYYQYKLGYIEPMVAPSLRQMIENGIRISAILKTDKPRPNQTKVKLEIVERL